MVMYKKIKGTADFKAIGAELYPFINGIRESNIVCMSQRCHNGAFLGCVYTADMNRLSALAEEYGISLEYTSTSGVPFRIYRYRFRFGIIAGIIILFSFIFYLSNIVVSVEVCGNKGVSSERIISALSEIGIYKGKFIADIDFHKSEQKLRLSIPELSWTGIRHTGSRIVVDVAEADPPPDMVREDIPCNIVAERDAQIVSIEVYAGRKTKSEGSGVLKGEVLISGVVDDGGGHALKKHALGKIIGKYEDEVKFEQLLSSDGKVYSGEELKKRYFDFFGFRIPLFLKKADCKSFDYSETSINFMFLGKKLPLGMVNTTYTPFEYSLLSYSTEEADILLQQKLSLYEKNFYDAKNIEVVNRQIKKSSSSEKLEYNVKYTLVGEIGIDYEIFVDRNGERE